MKLYFLLVLFGFLIIINSVNAIDVSSCLQINQSGYYQFSGNITSDYGICYTLENLYSCIAINSSDVTLNLNGNSLIDLNGSCNFGIRILPKNLGDTNDVWDNIKVQNGYLYGFPVSSIVSQGMTNTQFSNLTITNKNGDGFLFMGNNTNVVISNNNIYTILFNIHQECYSCSITDNKMLSTDGVYVKGRDNDIERNQLGFYIDNTTNCFRDYYPLDTGLTIEDANNTLFKNNEIISLLGIDVKGVSYNNYIKNNNFETYFQYGLGDLKPAQFSSTTRNNVFCSNQETKYIPTVVWNSHLQIWDCYYSTNTVNAYSYVTNSGTNNTITQFCTGSCSSWLCDNNYLIYLNSTCGVSQNYTCEYGCSQTAYGSTCIGSSTNNLVTTTTIQVYNGSYTQPIVNTTDLQEAGLSWLSPFFTPLLWIFVIELIISSIISWFSKQAMSFPIVMFIMTALLGYMGVLPQEITWLTCIITALASGIMYKMTVK